VVPNRSTDSLTCLTDFVPIGFAPRDHQRHIEPVLATVDLVERRILVVEDDKRIGASLLRALEGNGYEVTLTSTAALAEAAFVRAHTERHAFDLVLLDLGLPDADGLDVCRRMVSTDPFVPIIMLTARDEEIDHVIGLDCGAVDYITKPFSLAPLLARIRAQLRRNETTASTGNTAEQHAEESIREHIVLSDLTIDVAARRVMLHTKEILLRPKEFDLLVRLAVGAGTVVSRETLMSDVWDTEWFGSTKTLDFHIAALRAKLDTLDAPSMISTIRGVGFRFEN
jgi:DNA-binding response OmpR family regulator